MSNWLVWPCLFIYRSDVMLSAPEVKAKVHYCDHALPIVNFHIFDFTSETVEQNSMKFYMKQDLNILYQVCVFQADWKKQDCRPGLWLAETFSTFPLKSLNGIQQNMTGSKISMSSTKFVFFPADRKNKMAALASDWLRHFRLLLWNRWTEFNETWLGARSQRLLVSKSSRLSAVSVKLRAPNSLDRNCGKTVNSKWGLTKNR